MKDPGPGWYRVHFLAYFDVNAVSQKDANTSVQYALGHNQFVGNGMATKVLETGQVTSSEFLREEDEQ